MDVLKAIVRVVVALFVVAAGLLATIALGLVAALFFLLRRPRPATARAAKSRGAPASNAAASVIEVTATEVSADPEKAG